MPHGNVVQTKILMVYYKGEDISGIFNSQIQEWANKLNTRPRKCLNWKTPYEVFFNESLHLI